MNDIPMDSLRQCVQSKRESFIEDVRSWSAIESPTGHAQSQTLIMNAVAQRLKTLGYAYQIHQHERAPMLEIGDAKDQYQMVVGHTDTVWPVGQLKEQPLHSQHDYLYGPGVFDMKAGIAMLVLALEVIADLKLTLAYPIKILLNSDEETGSAVSKGLIADLAKDARRVWVLEPALGLDGALKTSRRGLVRLKLDVQGKAAHSGMDPESGVNAIIATSQLIISLDKLSCPQDGLHINAGTITGGVAANIVAPTASAIIEIRYRRQTQIESCLEQLSLIIESCRPAQCVFNIQTQIRPMESNQEQNQLMDKVHSCAQALGLTLKTAMSGGASDANTTSQFAATIDGLGAVGDGAHAIHEHIQIDATLKRASLLVLLLCCQ